MDGILVLVRRLSDLKAKQKAKGLKKLNLDAFTLLYPVAAQVWTC